MPVLDEAADARLASLRDILSVPDADEFAVAAFYANLVGWDEERDGIGLPADVLLAYLLTGAKRGEGRG